MILLPDHFPRSASSVLPAAFSKTIASTSQTRISGDKSGEPLDDQWEPTDSNDHSHPYLHWWPNKGTGEWVEYIFEQPTTVSEVKVYWFDDTGQGECRIPSSWKLLFRAGNSWRPVVNLVDYEVSKDQYDTLTFEPVRTSALRLELQLQEKFSAGIIEWKVR